MRRSFSVSHLLLTLGLILTALPLAAEEGSPTKPDSTVEDGTKENEPPSPRRAKPSPHSKIWWNQPDKVEALGLSQEQRQAMDQSLTSFLAVRAEAIAKQRQAFGEFGQALTKGDTEPTRQRGDDLIAAMSAPLKGQVTMMTEVASLLTAKQRQLLGERYPKLMSSQWIRSSGRLGMGRGNPGKGRSGQPR